MLYNIWCITPRYGLWCKISVMFLYCSVNRWEEPFDSTVYCVRNDGGNSLITGTATYGMTRLWDKRMSNPVQVM